MVLVLYACLAAHTEVCLTERMTYTDGGPLTCVMQGQFDAARWSQQNPGWHIKRTGCEDPRREAVAKK